MAPNVLLESEKSVYLFFCYSLFLKTKNFVLKHAVFHVTTAPFFFLLPNMLKVQQSMPER